MKTSTIAAKKQTARTGSFYDAYWPANVPNYRKTREHIREIVPAGHYGLVLDGGCGTGVCSVSLSEMAGKVIGLDISRGSIRTGERLAQQLAIENVTFCQGSLLDIPFPDNTFDLSFSWGVIHHTTNPVRALDELVRVLKPGGTIVLAVYLKTPLMFFHEAIRKVCLKIPKRAQRKVIRSIATLVRLGERLGKTNNVRDDNPYIESQVEDWYFVPQKYFFSIKEMVELFHQRGLTCKVVCEQTGRFRSSSNFIVRGQLRSK